MGAYFIRRLLLIIPTLWAIITINFFIVQIAPGGPVDQAIAAIEFGNQVAYRGRRSKAAVPHMPEPVSAALPATTATIAAGVGLIRK
jgi:ABC-type microcin C transport system permease subunit YejB